METSWKHTQLISLLLFLCCTCLLVSGQNESLIATPILQTNLVSPGYDLNLDYEVNSTYDYLVTTNYVNHTLTLQIMDCEIEADKNGDCLYDHLYIYDGPNSSSTLLADFCCFPTTGRPVYPTTGNQAYLLFQTDGTNNFKGFKMSYVSTGITTTTPASTTTTTTTTTVTTPTVTGASTGGDEGGNNTLYIIIGCAVGGFLLLVLLIILIVCCLLKSKRPATADNRDTKRVLWSRSNTMVQPFQASPRHLPPGSVTQTNIFEMNLPDSGRGGMLPPLSSKLELPGPAVEAQPIGKSI